MRKVILLLITLCMSLIGLSVNLHEQILTPSHNFDDGSIAHFLDCTVTSPDYTSVINGRVKTFWSSIDYNGKRGDKGAEMCIVTDGFNTKKEGWYGFTMNVGSDYRTDLDAGGAQIFGFSSNYYTWEAMLKITNNDLIMGYRGRGSEQPGAQDITDATVLSNVPLKYNHSLFIIC